MFVAVYKRPLGNFFASLGHYSKENEKQKVKSIPITSVGVQNNTSTRDSHLYYLRKKFERNLWWDFLVASGSSYLLAPKYTM